MKKVLQTAVLFLVLLFFVGCNSLKEPPDFPQSFDCNFILRQGELEVTGTFSRSLIGEYTFQITSPQPLEGLTFSGRNTELTLSYEDLSVPKDSPLPKESWFTLIIAAVDDLLQKGELTLSYSDERVLVYQGETYRIGYDAKTKNPVNLTIGDGICVEFYDMRCN
jgi:hypothetical protein